MTGPVEVTTRTSYASHHQQVAQRMRLVSVGNYEMTRLLGRGNFARVVEAVHSILKAKVLEMRYIVFPRTQPLHVFLRGSIAHVVYPRLEMRFPVLCPRHGRLGYRLVIWIEKWNLGNSIRGQAITIFPVEFAVGTKRRLFTYLCPGRHVAIKIIDTSRITQEYVIKNLTREAKLLSMLNHPSIVRLYETIQCGPVYYLVTELATGGDLYSHVRSQASGRLDEASARSYARQLVAALQHMHSRDIVHRDLKMENVMLQDEKKERIKIVDFGLSNVHDSANPLKTQCGSPEYAAPELFVRGKRYGPEVDLWSLGVILYVMGAGRLPFLSPRDGRRTAEECRRRLMAQINRGLAAPQERAISTLSAEYRELVARLLTPAAHRRIAMDELCRHPWIVDRRQLGLLGGGDGFGYGSPAVDHRTIVEELLDFTGMTRQAIDAELGGKRFGTIGGMYNIIAHELQRTGPTSCFKSKRGRALRKLKQNFNKPYAPLIDARSKAIRTDIIQRLHLPFSIAEYDRNSKKVIQAPLAVANQTPTKTVTADSKDSIKLPSKNLKKASGRPVTETTWKRLPATSAPLHKNTFRPLSEQITRNRISSKQQEKPIRSNAPSEQVSRQSPALLQSLGQGDDRRTAAPTTAVFRLAKSKIDASKLKAGAVDASKISRNRNKAAELVAVRAKAAREKESTGARFSLRKTRSVLKTLDKLKWKNCLIQQGCLDQAEKKKTS